jgi:hypothetical protein
MEYKPYNNKKIERYTMRGYTAENFQKLPVLDRPTSTVTPNSESQQWIIDEQGVTQEKDTNAAYTKKNCSVIIVSTF